MRIVLTLHESHTVVSLLNPGKQQYELELREEGVLISATRLTNSSWEITKRADTVLEATIWSAGFIVAKEQLLLDTNCLLLLNCLRSKFLLNQPVHFELIQSLHLAAIANYRLDRLTACKRILTWISRFDATYCECC